MNEYINTEDTPEDILTEALRITNGVKRTEYGDAKESMDKIAQLWTAYLGVPVSAHDVGLMMVLFKVSRQKTGEKKRDNLVDAAGYIRLASLCAQGKGYE